MNAQDLVTKNFERLVIEGTRILSASGWDGNELHQFPPATDYIRFRTEALNLVRRACGDNDDHYRELKRIAEAKESANNSAYFPHCMGIVQAAQYAFQAGLLFDLRALLSAEVLGDFIEQAEQLLEAGYHVPAASLIGAVLEDSLRKLCDKTGIPLPASTKIDRLNADLAKANVYDKLVQKRITALADIRNNADHGHFDKFKKQDVEDMVKWVRAFAADNLK